MRRTLPFLLIVGAAVFGQGRPQPASIFGQSVESYWLTAPNIAEALAKVADDFRIPIGIEWIKTSEATRKFSDSWQKTTVGAILADIVKAYPGYTLTISEGPVRVAASPLLGDQGNVLNYRVLSFTSKNQRVNEATVSLESMLAPIMTPRLPGEPNRMLAGSTISGGGDVKILFTMENATVADILDRLLMESDRTAWVVTYPAESSRTRAGFLRMLVGNEAEPKPDWYVPSFDLRLPSMRPRYQRQLP